MQQIGLDATINGVPDFTAGINKMNQGVDSFASNSTKQGGAFAGGFGEIVTGALRKVGELAVDALMKAGRAVGDFVKDSIGLAGDFESGMLNFQSVAGKDVDTAGLAKFKDLFLTLGKELPVSTSDVQKAAIEMVKGGIDPAAIAAGGLRQNIQFAAAAMGGDLVGAAEISSKILGGWVSTTATAAEKADFLTRSTDLLTKAANASATDVNGLAKGIFNAQGIAKTAGVPFDDLTTTLALLAPRFASSSEAGNSLKNMIARLQPTTDPATVAMMKLGLYTEDTGSAFYDANGNFVGFEKASGLLQDSLKGLTKEQQAAALQTIFGNDAMGSAAALADGGSAAYVNMAKNMNEANGVAEAAALKQQGFNTALDNAKGSVEALMITLGTALLPILTDLFNNTIAPGVNALTDFAEAFFKMVPAIQASDDPIQTFLNALKIAAPGMFDLIVQIEDIKDAITPAVQEIMRLADALSTGGIGGLIDALVTDISAALPDIEAALLEWGQAFIDWIAPMIPPALDALADMAADAWAWVKQQAPGWGEQLKSWGNELVVWIAPMIPPALAELGKMGSEFLGWIGEQAAPLVTKFQDWGKSFIAWIPGATVKFLAEWPKMFDQFLDWVGSEAGPLLLKLGDWALSFIGWIAPMIPGFLAALGGIALAIGVWVIETAAVLSKKITEVWVPAILKWIVTDAIPKLYVALDSFLRVIQGWIEDAEKSVGEWMLKVGTSAVQGIEKGIKDAWSSLTGWLSKKMSSLVDSALAAIGAGSPATEWMPVGAFSVQGIMEGFSSTWPALTSLVSELGDELVSQAANIADKVQSAIGDAFGATASVDRQKVANIKAVAKLSPAAQAGVQSQINAAEQIARAMNDPQQAAAYFKMRSQQLIELGDLSQQINEATDMQQRGMLQAQYDLINDAQNAELKQFDANAAQGNQTSDLAATIQALLANRDLPGLLDSPVLAQLAGLLAQLTSPAAAPSSYNGVGGISNFSQNTTLNMPIYTNQSASVLQDSMAIAGAALL